MVKNVSSYSSIRQGTEYCLDSVFSSFHNTLVLVGMGFWVWKPNSLLNFSSFLLAIRIFFRNFAGADSGRTRLRQDAGVAIGRVHYILKMRR